MYTNNLHKAAPAYSRATGLLYLIIIACGIFSEMYVRGTLIVWGNAAETTANIAAAPSLFRMGFISDLIMVICDIGAAIAFYILLKPVNKELSALAAIFRLIQAAILGVNLLNYYTPLLLLDGSQTLPSNVLNAQVMLSIARHSYGYIISGVFFGLSCLVLGYLLFKSGYFPKTLGILLVVGAVGYLTDCFTNFIFPQYASITETLVVSTAVIAELSLCLWLLLRGIRIPVQPQTKLFI